MTNKYLFKWTAANWTTPVAYHATGV